MNAPCPTTCVIWLPYRQRKDGIRVSETADCPDNLCIFILRSKPHVSRLLAYVGVVVGIQQHVERLQISVPGLPLMQVLHSLGYVADEVPCQLHDRRIYTREPRRGATMSQRNNDNVDNDANRNTNVKTPNSATRAPSVKRGGRPAYLKNHLPQSRSKHKDTAVHGNEEGTGL